MPTPDDPAAHCSPGHMTPDAFRAAGHRMVDEIADYMHALETMPVRPDAPPGTVLGALPDEPPETPESWDDIHRDLRDLIIPNLTHWQHPGFFAYFSCNASGPSILGEIASAGLNINGMLWSTSPAATELETRVLDWCRRVPEVYKRLEERDARHDEAASIESDRYTPLTLENAVGRRALSTLSPRAAYDAAVFATSDEGARWK